MRFRLSKCVSLAGAAAVVLFCSCEKHHVGEIPEVQKEHVDPAHLEADMQEHGPHRAETPPPAESR